MGSTFSQLHTLSFQKSIKLSFKLSHFYAKNKYVLYSIKWYSTTVVMLVLHITKFAIQSKQDREEEGRRKV